MTMETEEMKKPDLVYLWVDGSDLEWRIKRQRAAEMHNPSYFSTYSNVEGRFRDNQELKYSFRSLMPFIHQFRKVHLVTDNQKPSWLSNHPMLNLVHHQDFRKENHPTFSSICLEASLHLIPGLSSSFLYFNDDVFLGDSFSINQFFKSDNQQYCHFEKNEDVEVFDSLRQSPQDISRSILSSNKLVANYNHIHRNFAHAPRAVYLDKMRELETIFPEAFDKARREIFRVSGTPSIIADLYPRWMIATGLAESLDVSHQLISTGSEDLLKSLKLWQKNKKEMVFFCFNDTLDDAPNNHSNLKLVKKNLELAFPEKSIFEI